MRGWSVWLARPTNHRHDNRYQDAVERAERQHAEPGDDCPAKLHRVYVADGTELGRLDQSDRVDDDHCCERRIRHQSQQRCQQQHRCQCDTGTHQRRLLRLATYGADHGCLRRAASRRHGAEQCACKSPGSGRDQLAVRIDRKLARPGEGATRARGAACRGSLITPQREQSLRLRREALLLQRHGCTYSSGRRPLSLTCVNDVPRAARQCDRHSPIRRKALLGRSNRSTDQFPCHRVVI